MKKIVILAIALLLSLATAGLVRAESRTVYVYNWTEYIPEGVIERFTEETGIKVVYTTYESNEAMYAKLKVLDSTGFDVIFPSSYFVSKMGKEGMLMPIDKSKLNNFKNLDDRQLNHSFDPANRYSVPYTWGGTGILVNPEQVGPTPEKWADLWDSRFKGTLLLQDDLREVFGMALKKRGYSLNDTDPEHIREAYEDLVKLMPSVRTFNSDSPKVPFLNEEVYAGMIWNGEAHVAMEEMDSLRFVWPAEGAILWMDCLCIPAGAKNVDEAHAFIDFLLRPDVAATMVREWGYATPNKAAMALLDEATRNDPAIFPPLSVMEKSEFQNDIGEAVTVYEQYWNKLKANQ
jgi:spermidine/putrescine transport system substrate-binding protein